MSKKPVVTTNNGLFLVLAVNVHNQQNLRFIVGLHHPVVVLRPERPQVRILSGAPKVDFCNQKSTFIFSLLSYVEKQKKILRMDRYDLPEVLYSSLDALDGQSDIIGVCKNVWEHYSTNLENSGDLFYTWQYDIRWAATE